MPAVRRSWNASSGWACRFWYVDRRTADLNRSPGRSSPGVSLRTIAAVVIALLVLLFIVLNRDPTRISFIAFVAKAPLWVALAVAAAGGFVAGFLLSRRRYKGRALTLECGQYFTVRVSRSAGRRPARRGTVRGLGGVPF